MIAWIHEKYAKSINRLLKAWTLGGPRETERMPEAFWDFVRGQEAFTLKSTVQNIRAGRLCPMCERRTPFVYSDDTDWEFKETAKFCTECRSDRVQINEYKKRYGLTRRDLITLRKTRDPEYEKSWNKMSKRRKKKKEATCLERWGAKNPQATKEGQRLAVEGTRRKYGVHNAMLNPEVRKRYEEGCAQKDTQAIVAKSRATAKRKWGVDHYLKSKEGTLHYQRVLTERTGYHSSMLIPKNRKIHAEAMKNLSEEQRARIAHKGDANGMRTKHGRAAYDKSRLRRNETTINEKRLATIKEKFGVDHHMHLSWMRKKVLHRCFLLKKATIQGKTYTYQGYELPALARAVAKFGSEDVIGQFSKDAVTVSLDEGKTYSPDFYIRSINSVVEVKSAYTLFAARKLGQRKQACEKAGYKFILIVADGGEANSRIVKLPAWWSTRPKVETARWLVAQGVHGVPQKILSKE